MVFQAWQIMQAWYYISLAVRCSGILMEQPQIILEENVLHNFSIDLCTFTPVSYLNGVGAGAPVLVNMTAHCFCVYDPIEDVSSFCSVPGPTLIMYAGSTVQTQWYNKLEGGSEVDTARNNAYRDMHIVNIHTHGLHVSPGDDHVLIDIAPGASVAHTYHIPSDHYAPGTHWLHSNHHGSSSFLAHAGLLSALLVHYKDDESAVLLEDNLKRMRSNLLVIHYLWPIDASQCVCADSSSYATRNYCDEYCRFPQSTRDAATDYAYDVSTDLSGTQLFFVNGAHAPIIQDLVVDNWRMLRVINTVPHYWMQVRFSNIAECDWQLMAVDGIFLESARDLTLAPYFGEYIMSPGGRADIAMRCTAQGTYTIVTSQTNMPDALGELTRAPANHVLLQLTVNAAISSYASLEGNNVSTLPLVFPPRPSYLQSLLDGTTDIEIESDACAIEMSANQINGRSYDASYSQFSVNVNGFTEFQISAPHHVYHQHVNPFMLMTDIHDGFVAQRGDWHDVMGGTYRMRVYSHAYVGVVMMYCHFLQHGDEGMRAYYRVVNNTQYPCIPNDDISTDMPTASPTIFMLPTRAPSPTDDHQNFITLYGPASFSALDWILCGAILFVICCVCLCCYLCVRRRRQQKEMFSEMTERTGHSEQTEMIAHHRNQSSQLRPRVTQSFGTVHEVHHSDAASAGFDAMIVGIAMTKSGGSRKDLRQSADFDDHEMDALRSNFVQAPKLSTKPPQPKQQKFNRKKPPPMQPVMSASPALEPEEPPRPQPQPQPMPNIQKAVSDGTEEYQYEEYEEYDDGYYEQDEQQMDHEHAALISSPSDPPPQIIKPKAAPPPPPKRGPAPQAVPPPFVPEPAANQAQPELEDEAEDDDDDYDYETEEEPLYLSIKDAKAQKETDREKYLNDDDFQSVFEMSKEVFSKLPRWKQTNAKKQKGFF